MFKLALTAAALAAAAADPGWVTFWSDPQCSDDFGTGLDTWETPSGTCLDTSSLVCGENRRLSSKFSQKLRGLKWSSGGGMDSQLYQCDGEGNLAFLDCSGGCSDCDTGNVHFMSDNYEMSISADQCVDIDSLYESAYSTDFTCPNEFGGLTFSYSCGDI